MTTRLARAAMALLFAPVLAAQSPSATALSPAGEWRSFRGSYQQTGVSASVPPATLAVVAPTGETVSHQPRCNGVTCVGAATHRWRSTFWCSQVKHKTADNLISESSPVATARKHRDLAASCTLNAADGRKPVDVRPARRSNRRRRWSVDWCCSARMTAPLCRRCEERPAAVEGADKGPGALDTSGPPGADVHCRLRFHVPGNPDH
jgi:hypothetical protein